MVDTSEKYVIATPGVKSILSSLSFTCCSINIFSIVLFLSPRLLLSRETFDKSNPNPRFPKKLEVEALISIPTLLEICKFL